MTQQATRRHTAKTVAEAKTLRAGGFSTVRVGEILGVSDTTVRRWTDPAYAELMKRAHAAHNRRRGARLWNFAFPGAPTEEYKAAFAIRLHQERVSTNDVARVMTVVFAERWTYNRVRYLLQKAEVAA